MLKIFLNLNTLISRPMNKKKSLLFFLIMFIGLTGINFCQAQDDYVGHYLEFKNKIYHEQIKSCRIYPQNLEASFPLIRLGGGQE